MDGLEQDRRLLEALVNYADVTATEVAKKAKLAASTLHRSLNGTATTRFSQRTIDKLQDAYPSFPGWSRTPDSGDAKVVALNYELETPSSDDGLHIPMLELGYGLGGTFLDDLDGRATMQSFPQAFVRMFTSAPAEQLAVSYGIGDSMEPTITDRDPLLIDKSKDQIRINDQIWVVASGGIGMVKRVRVEPDGQIVLLSDNRNVPPIAVAEDDLTVIGRVVAVMKRM